MQLQKKTYAVIYGAACFNCLVVLFVSIKIDLFNNIFIWSLIGRLVLEVPQALVAGVGASSGEPVNRE